MDLPIRIEPLEYISLRNYYISFIMVLLVYMETAIMFTWSSPLLPVLRVSVVESAAIVSSCAMGAIMGPAVGALFVNRWGAKSILWLQTCLFFSSLIMVTLVQLVPCICVARALAGVAIGATLCHLPLYLEEIKDADLPMSTLRLYIVLVQILGYEVISSLNFNLNQQLIGLFVICVICISALLWLPQSPYYYVRSGQLLQAKTVIMFLERGISTSAVDIRIRQIQEKITADKRNHCDYSMLLSTKKTQKALALGIGLSSLNYLTGASVILTVLHPLLIKVESFMSASNLILIVVFTVTFTTSYFISSFGHKKVIVISTLFMAFSMLIFGLYLMNLEKQKDILHLSWMSLCCLITYLSAFHMGLAVKTDDVISSLFSWNSQLKILGTTLTSIIGFIIMFFITLLYFFLGDQFGLKIIMWTFAVFSILTSVLVQVFIPETRVMSSIEIEEYLESGSY